MREHIIINNDRTVVIPASVYKVGNRFDHGVNKVIFDCPRYADEEQTIDLSTMKIYINYIRSDKEPLSSLAMNVTVDETDPTIMHFVWDITRSVTFVDGVLDCLVCIKKTNAEGVEEHHWNSDIFSKLFVGKGMENTETIAEENIDLITQLLLEVDTAKAEVSGVSEAINAVDEKIGSLENLTTEDKSNVVDAVNEVKEASDNVAESVDGLKSDLGDIESAIDTHKNYTDVSIFEVGYYSLASSGVIQKNDVNAGYKKYKLESVPSGNYMVLNLRGVFCIIEDLITGTKRKLATTYEIISGLITIENKSNVYLTISGDVEKTYFVSGTTPVPVYVDKVGLYSYILEDNVKPTIYVKKKRNR